MPTTRDVPCGAGHTDRLLEDDEIERVCEESLSGLDVEGRRILCLIPDHTRTCPLERLFPSIYRHLGDRAAALDFLVALGTHPPLDTERILRRVGITAAEHRARYPDVHFFNHEWRRPDALETFGTIPAADIREITSGRLAVDVPVRLNRRLLDYDLALIVGPVFPHEVAGFSGGNKYLVPGVAGPEIIDFFHWLGALITNPRIIGVKHTPVRRVIDRAAAMAPLERLALCMVSRDGGLAGLYFGTPEAAWSAAADLSAQVHVVWTERTYHTVLSCAPAMYDELWVAGKCVYKLEPVVEDGGTLIVYAPHVQRISATHGELIERIGYHVRDYFLARWERFADLPWGVLAHSTHVRGVGTFENGVERPRIEVVLATGIPAETCRRIGLGHLDPAAVRLEDYQGREHEGVLCVPRAGETLYRPRPAQAAQT